MVTESKSIPVADLEIRADAADLLVERAIPLVQSAIATEGLRLVNGSDVDRIARAAVRTVALMFAEADKIVAELQESE